jgi:uncharacterized protein
MFSIKSTVRALLLASTALLFAQQPAQNQQGHPNYDRPEGFVSDFAGVIDTPSRVQAEDYLASLQRATGVQFAVVAVPTTGGEPIEDFANNLARKWGIGQKGKNEGLLMLLAIQDRKIRVEVGYGLEAVLPDGYVGSVQRTMREDLRGAKYGAAIVKAVRTMGAKVAESKGVQGFDAPQPPRVEPGNRRGRSRSGGGIPWWVIVAAALFLLPTILAFFKEGRRNRGGRWGGGGPFFGGGGGFGGWSSGGGGSDGGGFSGFGGGDFGGGGASSDW